MGQPVTTVGQMCRFRAPAASHITLDASFGLICTVSWLCGWMHTGHIVVLFLFISTVAWPVAPCLCAALGNLYILPKLATVSACSPW